MTYHKEMGVAQLYRKIDDLPCWVIVFGDESWDAFVFNGEDEEGLDNINMRDSIDNGDTQDSILDRYYLRG